jgi:hypothetical protein
MRINKFVSLMLLCGLCAYGQSGNNKDGLLDNTASPIEVRLDLTSVDSAMVPYSSTLVPAVSMTVANLSGKCIRGYVVAIRFTRSDGRVIGAGHTRLVLSSNKNGDLGCIPQGDVKSVGKPLAIPKDSSGELAKYNARVDLIAFEDGSEWGPGKLPDSERLRGMIQALTDVGKVVK